MAVHSLLNAFSFDISLIEIGQEIKLLEHLKKNLDHPVEEEDDKQGVFTKCAEILPTRLWDNVED
jgi:hypothetical protein